MRQGGRRRRRGRGRPGPGARVYLRLRLRPWRHAGTSLRDLRQAAGGGGARWLQRHCARVWSG